jgi:hypothetical protein
MGECVDPRRFNDSSEKETFSLLSVTVDDHTVPHPDKASVSSG